jgi:hypothetical protein
MPIAFAMIALLFSGRTSRALRSMERSSDPAGWRDDLLLHCRHEHKTTPRDDQSRTNAPQAGAGTLKQAGCM